jgi:peptidyl-prolyl cis-trans isomerase A (cyclophilin A)
MNLFNHKPTHPEFPDVSDVKGARIHTNQGVIEVSLFSGDVPMTVGNFVGLAEGTVPWKRPDGSAGEGPLYKDIIFHRVIPRFMLQGGDPEGSGRGGPGYRFGDEFKKHLKHDKPGILSMANAGPRTNGSQFFITTVPTPHLDGRHTVFGAVTGGMDVVTKIEQCPKGGGDRPLEDQVITHIEIMR